MSLTVAERIRSRREALGISQEELARRLGYRSRTSVTKIESGARTLRQQNIKPLADALETTPSYIMGWEEGSAADPEYPSAAAAGRKIPLLGSVACGTPILAEQNVQRYVELPEGVDADFCLLCRGDSMSGARIFDGDLVFIRRQSSVDNGQIAAVVIEDEATLKRVFYDPKKSKLILQAENPKYEPLVYIGEELDGIRIAGLAVSFLSRVI